MALSAPRHWYRPPGLLSTLLSPLGALYAAGTARKLRRGAKIDPGVPVICVGNLTAGGTGKTPVVMDLAARLAGRTPHILSRGYGGTVEGPHQVDPIRDRATDVGDEPVLLSGFAPVWVAHDRALGAEKAVAEGAGVLILDDGFQNASLAYDLSIIVVDAGRGFGNGQVIPAGPLREPIANGLARADLLVLIGSEEARYVFQQKWGARISLPQAQARLEPLPTGIDLNGQKVIAFAGIGDPEKFFATLRGVGAKIERAIALGDHQPLTPALMRRIEQDADARRLPIVTTEKDACRLPVAFRQKIITLPVRVRFDDDTPLRAALRAKIEARS